MTSTEAFTPYAVDEKASGHWQIDLPFPHGRPVQVNVLQEPLSSCASVMSEAKGASGGVTRGTKLKTYGISE